VVFKATFTDEMEQSLHIRNLDDARASESVQSIVRESSLADIAERVFLERPRLAGGGRNGCSNRLPAKALRYSQATGIATLVGIGLDAPAYSDELLR